MALLRRQDRRTVYGSEGSGSTPCECLGEFSGQDRRWCRSCSADRRSVPGGAAAGVRPGAGRATGAPPSGQHDRPQRWPSCCRDTARQLRPQQGCSKRTLPAPRIKWLDRIAQAGWSRPPPPVIPCVQGDGDSRSDSNTSIRQSNLAHADDHRYRMDHALTHGCPYLIRKRSVVQVHSGPSSNIPAYGACARWHGACSRPVAADLHHLVNGRAFPCGLMTASCG
jgi:hypothetical protein